MNNLFQEIKNKKLIIICIIISNLLLFFVGCSMSRNDLNASNNSSNTTNLRPESPGDTIEVPDEAPAVGNGSINISVNTSRVTGIAPLSVFFDATSTTGLADNGFFSDNAAYMDATFSWNFDADNIDSNGKYKKASGFLTAHVFEHSGTYRVQLNVYDAVGNAASKDIYITVNDFTGNTYYVSSNSSYASDSNDGSIVHPFLTPKYALTGSHMQPNTRILFKQGDTFNTSFFYVWDYDGPVIIDSYFDDGTASGYPSSSTDNAEIHSTEADSGYATFSLYTDDWRVMNLEVTSGGNSYNEGIRYPSGIGFSQNSTNNLKYRVVEHYLGGLGLSPNGQYNTIAECEYYNVNSTGFSSSEFGDINDGGAIIGNWVHDKTGDDEEHIFRLQGGSRYFIANNIFGPNILVNYDALTIRGNSEKVVIYKNKLMGYVQAIWPQNRDSAKEYQHHCIFDSNLIIGQGVYSLDRNTGIALRAKDIVVRNNIIYDYKYGVSIDNDTVVGASRRIKVYNNTFINPRASDTFNSMYVDANCYDIEIKNNIMLDIGGSIDSYSDFLIIGNGSVFGGSSDYNICYGTGWGASLTLFDGLTLAAWQSSTTNDLHSSIANPQLISTDYNSVDFCKPQTNSPVIDSENFTPAALDYYGYLRDDLRDIGACEY